jgi:hypothetical protein
MERSSYLLHETSIENLSKSFDEIIGFKSWSLRKGSLDERSKGIKYFGKKFKDHFKTNLNRDIQDVEVISYFDTMTLLKRLDEKISIKEIQVFMEFSIPYAHQKRIDYILTFKNTIIILEFSYFNENDKSIKNDEYMKKYHEKLVQAMQYQTLLQNMIDSKIKIIPFVILYQPEYDNEIEIKGSIEQNNNEIEKLCEMINSIYPKDMTAAEELLNLKS